MALTKAQRANLDALATYLEKLPANYRHFGMACFLDGDDDEAIVKYARENGGVRTCGTAACAVGHGPAAGILVPERMISPYVDWDEYTALFAPVACITTDWSFGGAWSRIDNTHHGAAARIRYLLEHGEPPEGYLEPARKWKPLYAPYRIDAKAKADA